jgi:hypothetical protein
MRVEIHLEPPASQPPAEIPWEDAAAGATGKTPDRFLDLRGDPQLIERLDAARRSPPLRNFLVAVNDADSFFFTTRSKAGPVRGEAAAKPDAHEFAIRVQIAFTPTALNSSLAEWEEVAARLQELLTRESGADTLSLELLLQNCRYAAAPPGFCMDLELHARGATPQQAELRCGLGLARLQQALLFTSRTLRQKLGEAN